MGVNSLGMKNRALKNCRLVLLFAISLSLSLTTQAQTDDAPIPTSSLYLTDYCDAVSEEKQRTLEKLLHAPERDVSVEFRIVLVKSTNGAIRLSYAQELWRGWRIGSKKG